jgi:hypothetical protein
MGANAKANAIATAATIVDFRFVYFTESTPQK